EGVVDVRPCAAARDEPLAAQEAQALRDGRELLAGGVHELRHAALAGHEQLQEPQPRRVPQGAEDPAGAFQVRGARDGARPGGVVVGMAVRCRHGRLPAISSVHEIMKHGGPDDKKGIGLFHEKMKYDPGSGLIDSFATSAQRSINPLRGGSTQSSRRRFAARGGGRWLASTSTAASAGQHAAVRGRGGTVAGTVGVNTAVGRAPSSTAGTGAGASRAGVSSTAGAAGTTGTPAGAAAGGLVKSSPKTSSRAATGAGVAPSSGGNCSSSSSTPISRLLIASSPAAVMAPGTVSAGPASSSSVGTSES